VFVFGVEVGAVVLVEEIRVVKDWAVVLAVEEEGLV
jgi:hypothetical protein